MEKLRFLIALWMAKLSIPVLKITKHNGTDFPGSLALRICPRFLKHIGRPKTIVAVTGTNGKTTVTNLIGDMFEKSGKKVLSNKAGSNIASGISTVLLKGCNIFGKAKKYDLAVLEVDERSSLRIYPYVKPNYVVITNLFRDSIMRNGHPAYIAGILDKYIPKDAKLILNADDLISAMVAPSNERVYFGIDKLETDVKECINKIDDVRICPVCNGKLEYEYRRYHHIGKAKCVDCDFASPSSDFLATNVDIENGFMTIVESGNSYEYKLIADSIFNIYNMVTVITLFRQFGYEHAQIKELIENTAIAATRHSVIKVGGITIINQMAKDRNALATSRAFDYIAGKEGNKEVFLMMNNYSDSKKWSENTCWIYDSDFEFLADEKVEKIVCTGPRGYDYRLRLRMAGVPADRIVCIEDELEAAEALPLKKGNDIYLLYGTDALTVSFKVCEKIQKLAVERNGEGN